MIINALGNPISSSLLIHMDIWLKQLNIYIVELLTKVEGHYYTILLGRAPHYSTPTLIYHTPTDYHNDQGKTFFYIFFLIFFRRWSQIFYDWFEKSSRNSFVLSFKI